jgi:hypothetical protein
MKFRRRYIPRTPLDFLHPLLRPPLSVCYSQHFFTRYNTAYKRNLPHDSSSPFPLQATRPHPSSKSKRHVAPPSPTLDVDDVLQEGLHPPPSPRCHEFALSMFSPSSSSFRYNLSRWLVTFEIFRCKTQLWCPIPGILQTTSVEFQIPSTCTDR